MLRLLTPPPNEPSTGSGPKCEEIDLSTLGIIFEISALTMLGSVHRFTSFCRCLIEWLLQQREEEPFDRRARGDAGCRLD